MKVAELLSDLTSLQVCDPAAALALVSARRQGQQQSLREAEGDDEDLTRAKDLLDLHASVNMAHHNAMDKGLDEARKAVAQVLDSLK